MIDAGQVALTLYDYPRSSAAYRVRIALNFKQLQYQSRRILIFFLFNLNL